MGDRRHCVFLCISTFEIFGRDRFRGEPSAPILHGTARAFNPCCLLRSPKFPPFGNPRRRLHLVALVGSTSSHGKCGSLSTLTGSGYVGSGSSLARAAI